MTLVVNTKSPEVFEAEIRTILASKMKRLENHDQSPWGTDTWESLWLRNGLEDSLTVKLEEAEFERALYIASNLSEDSLLHCCLLLQRRADKKFSVSSDTGVEIFVSYDRGTHDYCFLTVSPFDGSFLHQHVCAFTATTVSIEEAINKLLETTSSNSLSLI